MGNREKLLRASLRVVPCRVTTRELREAAAGRAMPPDATRTAERRPSRLDGVRLPQSGVFASRYAVAGLTAAALALPLGLLLGRRLRSENGRPARAVRGNPNWYEAALVKARDTQPEDYERF